jgi:hypothetical protein
MSCRCAKHMRQILKRCGFKLIDGWWVRGEHRYEDSKIEDYHKEIFKKWFVGEARQAARDFFNDLKVTS